MNVANPKNPRLNPFSNCYINPQSINALHRSRFLSSSMAGVDRADDAVAAATASGDFNFLIVSPENGGFRDLFKFLVYDDRESGAKFLESGGGGGEIFQEGIFVGSGDRDHRWVIVASIIARKILRVLCNPMGWLGYLVEFVLNLLSLNGNFLGLLFGILHGNVEMPKRGSETFISAIGHLDGRMDLFKPEAFSEGSSPVEMGNRALMDMCMMASKLSYENNKVVRNVVDLHWKMHFVAFYNCWNDYEKDNSTQVFIMCDKPKDTKLILIAFRGTESFDADDWITDFDYSWYEIAKLGKVHMGFLEALGLGSRGETSTFYANLQAGKETLKPSESNGFQDSGAEKELIPSMVEMSAYYAVKSKLKVLLREHKDARFVVTGHSLGGALAILFPTVLVLHEEESIMGRLLGVYTFGQPRVGDGRIGRYMEAHLDHPESKYFRVVYCNDLVPRLPYDNKTFLYKHFGLCLYYNSFYVEQNVDEEPNRNYFGWRFLVPQYLNSVWELLRSFTMGYICGPDYRECWESFMLRVVGLAFPGFSDHSPVDYVNCVRLGRRRSLEMISL